MDSFFIADANCTSRSSTRLWRWLFSSAHAERLPATICSACSRSCCEDCRSLSSSDRSSPMSCSSRSLSSMSSRSPLTKALYWASSRWSRLRSSAFSARSRSNWSRVWSWFSNFVLHTHSYKHTHIPLLSNWFDITGCIQNTESGFPWLYRTFLCAFSRTFQDHLRPFSMSFQDCLIDWIPNKSGFHITLNM